MDIIDSVRERVRQGVLGENVFSFGEATDSAEKWWDGLPGKRKQKVCDYLGLSKSSRNRMFGKFSTGVQAEIEAYFVKHKGRVEGVELSESPGRGVGRYVPNKEWKGAENAVAAHNKSLKDLEKALVKLALSEDGPDKSPYPMEAVRLVRAQMGKKINW